MADEKKAFTQAELDELTNETRNEGLADGINRAAEWLDGRADQLEVADKNHGFFEAEIAILRWASKRVGAL